MMSFTSTAQENELNAIEAWFILFLQQTSASSLNV